ncbi:hypothetical protein RFI_35300 [Reticulomyxa filosa]|uniref:Uncharacterized protein n=1 Tax=Reticulomyxa filosa TaxID=46433 RepID=X6LL81_RETFI|nr:hypothetical protein RFI_35300 [Reticulomyxa filosa]|eukprot:ETO02141.1 hypothetical protein RFI_35300 [Reticulomyxa filosa]
MLATCLIGSLLVSSGIASASFGPTAWTDLKTTWSAAPFKGFIPVPTSLSDAKSRGWDEMLTCAKDSRVGYLYAENEDISSMPFYNSNGQIYGIILGMTDPGQSSEIPPFNSYTLSNGTAFWGVQAYFRDPAYVCSDTSVSTNEKIGDRLWFRVGDNFCLFLLGPNSFYEVPLVENSTTLDNDGWLMGGCFVGMGMHYWRYVSVDMDCNTVYPIFLLYTEQKLTAWGIAMAHDDRPYCTLFFFLLLFKRWEHPGGDSLKFFFQEGDMPTCLPNQGTLSTQHVYLGNPLWYNCLGDFQKIF